MLSQCLPGRNIEKNDNCERYVVKFEDLKCNPKQTLQRLCDLWELSWSETLMKTTRHGQRWVWNNGRKDISDFDLTPVYNTYDEYLSGLDKLKRMIITAPWQRKYGYPYMDEFMFSQRELQEMFLKECRFEEIVKTGEKRRKLEAKIKDMDRIHDKLWENKVLEFEENMECIDDD